MDYSTRHLCYLAEQADVAYVCQDERTLHIQLRRQRNIMEIHYQVALHVAEQLRLEGVYRAFSLSELRERLEAHVASLLRQKSIKTGSTIRFSPEASNHADLTGVVSNTKITWTKQGLPVIVLLMENERQETHHCVVEILLYAHWVSQ